MKKILYLLLAACMVLSLAACGAAPAEPEIKDWSREGYYQDENENMLSVVWMEDVDVPGWYVGVMLGDVMTGCVIEQDGNDLHGDLNAWDESAEPFVVTLSEEGEDGLLLTVEGGESYHFTPMDLPEATIFITINVEGWGNIDHAEGEEAPEIDPEYPFQSAQINLAEPATYTFVAWPKAGNVFVKWMKNGEDYSTEPQITLLLDETADYIAVFEEDPGWQNPVMNFIGEYQCDRAHALVECFDADEALITIDWAGSVAETAQWVILGRLDTDTLTITYSGSTKSIIVRDESGEIASQDVEYDDGTGTIVFHDDGTFTWHEEQADHDDMVFEWLPVTEN